MEFITGVSSFLLSAADLISQEWQNAIPQLNLIAKLVQWLHSWVGSYGWAVVIFTVFLKLITLPVDIWQRMSTKKNAEKMKSMQKQVEKIEKQYANDQKRLNDEKQKLYKKQGYGAFKTCLPMIITMAIFMIMFTGLNSYSAYINVHNYALLEGVYLEAYYGSLEEGLDQEVIDRALQAGQEAYTVTLTNPNKTEEDALAAQIKAYRDILDDEALEEYEEELSAKQAGKGAVESFYKGEKEIYNEEGKLLKVKENFLWIKNIWRPDTWESIMADFDSFESGGMGLKAVENTGFLRQKNYDAVRNAVLEADPGYFAKVNEDGSMALKSDGKLDSGWNGILILPVLAMALAFLSSFLTQKQNKGAAPSDPTQQSQKTMMFLMPVMMGVFGFMYTSAFAVYLVSNSLLTLLINLFTNAPINRAVEQKVTEEENKNKASYMR